MNNKTIAILLALTKWPLAIGFFAFLPSATVFLFRQLYSLVISGHYLWPLIFGFTGYCILWLTVIRRTSISWLSTLEHEFTHCIFAWLTLNKVTAIKATLRSGGHMSYEGTPNWLIMVSPYFFPTVSVVLLVSIAFISPNWTHVIYIALGASIAYHIASTWTETHHLQTDLQRAGFVFCFMFLPTANILSYSLMISYLQHGNAGMVSSINSIYHSPISPIHYLPILTKQLAI